jgi:signal peptidase II
VTPHPPASNASLRGRLATTIGRRELVSPGRFLLFSAFAVAGCAVDLLTKHYVFAWRGMPGERPIWWLWEGILGIETSLNTGALFGMGTDKVLWFAALSSIALLGVLGWFVFGGIGRSRSLTIVLGCITAGILGNLYDRLGLWSLGATGRPEIHAVRDWIRISYGAFVWPNFNIADSLLVCSAFWLAWNSFQVADSPVGAAAQGSAPPTGSSPPGAH